MPPSSAGRASALRALAALKSNTPGLKLKKKQQKKKSDVGDDDDDGDEVFPVELRLPLPSASLPSSAEAFDVPQAWLLASIALIEEEHKERSNDDALSISVSSFECEGLPQRVLDRAAAGLRAAFSSSSTSTSISLAALPAAAGAAFFAAVQSLAHLEPYETVDASGASVRRFAVVREEVKVEVEVREKPKPKPKPRPLLPSRTPFLPKKLSSAAASSPAEAEMRFLERRFGASLSIMKEEEEEEEGEEEEQKKKKETRRRRFRVSNFTPSDPNWKSGPVSLLGTIDFARYPSPGSFSLFAEVEEGRAGKKEAGGGKGEEERGGGSVAAARLTLALRRAATAATAASSSASATDAEGAEQALRSLVRLADSRGGELSAAPAFALSDDDDGDSDEGESEEDETESDDDEEGSSSSGSGIGSSGSSDSSGSETESTSESESESEEEDETGAAAAPSSSSSSAANASGSRFAVSFSSLSLDGVEALSPASISLELSCLRCSGAVLPPALLASDASSSSTSSPLRECETCRAPLSLSLLPRVAHATSSVIAVMRCSGCVPKDLLLPFSSFGAQCERCSRVAALRGAANGSGGSGSNGSSNFALRRACPSCHAALAVLFEGCLFERMAEVGRGGIGSGGGGGAGAQSGRRKKKNENDGDGDGGKGTGKGTGGGTPLPLFGACDHYPHSHRAMRFPCCFRVFPCDVCHELSAASDAKHPAEVASVATKMVCGFCSREQPFERKGGPAVCKRCGKHLAGSSRVGAHGSGTRHWEGGKGCRDRRRLDRRDSRKYAGSKLKTVSKKAAAAAKKKKQQRGEKKK